MKKLAFTAMFMGAFGLVACGGGGSSPDAGDIDLFPDANTGPDAPPPGPACNPVANTGCNPGEKCTYIVASTDPFLGFTDCAPDGTVPTGSACTRNSEGVDDCQGGNWCTGSVCEEICSQSPNSCAEGFSCIGLSVGGHTIFSDVEGTGFCSANCNPLNQNSCPQGENCYLSLQFEEGSCAAAFEDNVQGQVCTALNGCARGFGCILPEDAQSSTLTCSFYCDADDAGGPMCADGTGAGPAMECVPINGFYGDLQTLPLNIGMCVECDDWSEFTVCGGGA